MGAKTEELRGLARQAGVEFTCGLLFGGRRVNEDNVTMLWPVPGDASQSVCLEEDEDGALWVADDVTPAQALAMVEAQLKVLTPRQSSAIRNGWR